MTQLNISNVKFSYGRKPILDGVSIALKQGEILCLLGPNGSGKSTLMNCIMSERFRFSGQIKLKGQDIKGLDRRRKSRSIGYVPQSNSTTFAYSVFQMILMGRTPHIGLFESPGKKDELLVNQVSEALEIDHLMDQKYNTLSGGEKQLVKIARGLVQEAEVLMMDEPTAALDLKHEMHLLEVIGDLVKKQGKSIMMSTHYPNQALYFESLGVPVTVGLLKDGVIKYAGKPSEVIKKDTILDVYGIHSDVFEYINEDYKGHVLVPFTIERTGGTYEKS